MLYLLYLRNGSIKKFPLDKPTILLGRSRECDFLVDESYISKKHAEITVHPHYIRIKDMNSFNGIFTDVGKVQEASLLVNQWFRIGFLKFFLKEGNPDEFVLSEKIRPLLLRLSKTYGVDTTNTAVNILYTEHLKGILEAGLSLDEYGDLFKNAEMNINLALEEGCLLLLCKQKNSKTIESLWNFEEKYEPDFQNIVMQKELYVKQQINTWSREHIYFSVLPVHLREKAMALVYISEKMVTENIIDFLQELALEIYIIYTLIEQGKESKEQASQIIAKNHSMRILLSRCKKIARSTLNVLIEGETGTGKELFARFIHNYSSRNNNFIVFNCAAIAENLMEVELFGQEKDTLNKVVPLKKGKLELASNGTLVLDEINEMPLNLQTKLLRTIQEGQFYRIGGNTPIEVNLRIISLTKKNQKIYCGKASGKVSTTVSPTFHSEFLPSGNEKKISYLSSTTSLRKPLGRPVSILKGFPTAR